MKVPVLLLAFNRPEVTFKTFERIRAYQPTQFFIAVDGPRVDQPAEKELCAQVRSVVDRVDWPCEVKTLFRDKNLGVVQGVITGITWFFEQVESGVILEDDCVAEITFFDYCAELLARYASHTQIKHISGSQFKTENSKVPHSYYFSRIPACWGWATWRRAWAEFDFNLVKNTDEETHLRVLKSAVGNRDYHFNFWQNMFNYHREGRDNIWDYRWTYCIWYHNGIVISPAVNMISNIGFGADATTTKGKNELRNTIAALPTQALDTLVHPEKIEINERADRRTQRVYCPPLPFHRLIRHHIAKRLPSSVRSVFRSVFD